MRQSGGFQLVSCAFMLSPYSCFFFREQKLTPKLSKLDDAGAKSAFRHWFCTMDTKNGEQIDPLCSGKTTSTPGGYFRDQSRLQCPDESRQHVFQWQGSSQVRNDRIHDPRPAGRTQPGDRWIESTKGSLCCICNQSANTPISV